MKVSFYSEKELSQIGFKSYGSNVLISRKCSIYNPEQMQIGNNVRIDDFCVLSGKIKVGSYIHISTQSVLFGGNAGIELDNFVSVSSRSAVYAVSDDFSGSVLTNPMVPSEYTCYHTGKVILQKHVIIGTGSTILPGVIIGEGTAVGSMSLVNKSLESWGIYVGIPCKFMKNREKKLLELEKELVAHNEI